MKIEIEIPDAEWALLAARADAHGLKVPDLIRAGIREVMPHGLPLGEHVRLLVRAGYPDAVVAERLGMTNRQVSEVRRRAGLPANRFHRGASRVTERKAS